MQVKQKMKTIALLVFTLLISIALSGCTNLKVDSIRNDLDVYGPSPIPVETSSISIEGGKFYPQIIEINAGQTVTFTNFDNKRHLIVSDPHPQHDKLPDLYSNWLSQNESYDYRMARPGEYGVHLEDNPSVSAKIIVR